MRIERTIWFDREDRDIFQKLIPLRGIICEDEEFAGSDARRDLKKANDGRSGAYAILGALAQQNEAYTEQRLRLAGETIATLLQAVTRQATEQGWPTPQNDVERDMRRVLIEARRSQLPDVQAAFDLIGRAHRAVL